MPCYKTTTMPGGTTAEGLASYRTEADCLQACREGACCEGTTCTVKPACQCQGAGKVFKGVGTACSNPGIAFVTATVQAQDYLTQRRAANTGSSGRLQYEDASVGLVGSLYDGTFTLSPAAASDQWGYSFPLQRSGTCVGSIQLYQYFSGLQIRFTYSVVSWVLYPYATAGSGPGSQFNYVVDPTDPGLVTYMLPGSSQTYRVPRYKELADMECMPSGIWQGEAWDPNAGYRLSTGPTRTQTWAATPCELFGTTPWSKTFQPVFPPSTTVLHEEGVNSLTLSLSVSSNPLP